MTPFAALPLALCRIAGTAAICRSEAVPQKQAQPQCCQAAVRDAIAIERGEILPLVTITADSDMVTWRDGKVLLSTANGHPERCIGGETLALPSAVRTVDKFIGRLEQAAR